MLVKLTIDEQKLEDARNRSKDMKIDNDFIDSFYIPNPINGFPGFYNNLNIDISIQDICNESVKDSYSSFSGGKEVWNASDLKAYAELVRSGYDIRDNYGVCDNIDQILNKYPELQNSDRKFIVSLVSMLKSEQSKSGGWRWHKWGEYIGEQNPTHEYLYDEPEIEEVFVYHIYELE